MEVRCLCELNWRKWRLGLTVLIYAVLWRGAAPIEGAANMISLLRSLNKRVVFVVSWSC